jgi:hypothetical protein
VFFLINAENCGGVQLLFGTPRWASSLQAIEQIYLITFEELFFDIIENAFGP